MSKVPRLANSWYQPNGLRETAVQVGRDKQSSSTSTPDYFSKLTIELRLF